VEILRIALPTNSLRDAARTNVLRLPLWFLLACFVASSEPARAQDVSKEYQVKAVFLWRLAQFVTWPSNAFENESSPIVIGVLGENPFGNALSLAVQDETVHGRKIVVQRFRRVSDVRTCHILYISRSEANRVAAINKALARRSILTVSDIPNFAADGGMVRFVSDEGKIKLRVNLESAKSAQLNLDARLLRMADVIRNG
jgi:hypothetical protein